MSTIFCAPGTNTSTAIVDPDFVAANNCNDPCASVLKSEIFRPVKDLILLNTTQVSRAWAAYGYDVKLHTKAETGINSAVGTYFRMSTWVFPYVILQGAHTVCFGRRSPRQVRDLLWIGLTKRSPKNWPHVRKVQRGFVGFFAAFVYLGAWFVAMICTPGVLWNIVANELLLSTIDIDAESPYMIGQWGPWCSTGLVLLAALIGRYHRPCVDAIFNGLKRLFTSRKHRQSKGHSPDTRHHPVSSDTEKGYGARVSAMQQPRVKKPSYITHLMHQIGYHFYESCIRFVDEWKNFGAWCRDPDQVCVATSRHPPKRLMGHGVDPLNPEASKPALSSATPSILACNHGPDEQCTNCASVRAVSAQDRIGQHDYSVKQPATGDISHTKILAMNGTCTAQEGTGEERRPFIGESARSTSSLSLPREVETRSVHPFRDNPDYTV